MALKRSVDMLFLVLLIVSLLAGTWYLMTMRFQAGDVYPPYSSLRTDPLGTKALYDALEHLNSDGIRRHYTRIEDLDAGHGDTVLILGTRAGNLDVLETDLDRLAADGTRVVVTFNEHRRVDRIRDGKDHVDNPPEEEPEEVDADKNTEDEGSKVGSWGLEMNVSGAVADSTGKYRAGLNAPTGGLPGEITTTSPVYFKSDNGSWREIYSFDDGPVMIERTIGQGSVVLLSDSYPVSNEALRWELYPHLLSWLLSGTRNVVFVEYHLGVRESQGVMTLIRKYRLITLLACFAVIALLAVWKNAVPLVKVLDKTGRDDDHILSEKDQFTGLVSLLKRNIGTGSIVMVCLQEMRKSYRGRLAGRGSLDEALREVSGLATREKDPARAYNRITGKFSERIKG